MYLNMTSTGLYMCDRHDHQDIFIHSYEKEDVTMYQDGISSALTESWERIGNILQVTWGI